MRDLQSLRPAAGIIPYCTPQRRVFLVRRSVKGSFFPGFHAFPGGAQEKFDVDSSECAMRELFEETGLWSGLSPSAADRRALLERRLPFAEIRQRTPFQARLLLSGRRDTPSYSPIRFSAQFFLWECDPDEVGPGEIWPGELEEGRWWGVEEALEAWRRNEISLAAPTQDALQTLARSPQGAIAAEIMQARSRETGDCIPVGPGLAYVALETPTLPPARHTLCFILGEDNLILIDPGSEDESELGRLRGVIGQRTVQAVVLSHHHRDHWGGAAWAHRQGWPLWAHPASIDQLGGLPIARRLEDGDLLEPAGSPPFRVLHTPGHARGHLAFWDDQRRILLASDLVSGVSTILVHPPDGSMVDYLRSLERCRALEPRLVLPSHGGPYGPGSDLLGRTLSHRLEREGKILTALRDDARSLEELLAEVYTDTPRQLWELAALSLQAHLEKLLGEGRALAGADGYRRAT